MDAGRRQGLHWYVYGVLPAGSARLEGTRGLDDQALEEITEGTLSALVSPVGGHKVRPTRANLSAHQAVVSAAHRLGPVLPVRFGTVFPDDDTVRKELLAPEQLRLESMLAEFAGKDEFRVRCRYLPDVALREVVERNPSIGKLRARAAGATTASAQQAHQVRLGELVMRGLEQLRERDAASVIDFMVPHILAWEPLDNPSDDVPVHAAVLVDRRRIRELEECLEKVAARQKERMQVELIGPLPLWDFSHVSAGVA